VPAGLPLPLNRMPERVDEYSDTKNAPDYVEKNKCRMVRDLNAAGPLNRVGKQYDGNSEATKREQSESPHIATRQVGERFRSMARDLEFSIRTDFIARPLHLVVRLLILRQDCEPSPRRRVYTSSGSACVKYSTVKSVLPSGLRRADTGKFGDTSHFGIIHC
jgi:hypothetical protein